VQRQDDGRASITLLLKPNDATRQLWDAEFGLRYTVTIGTTLTISLETRNVGTTVLSMTQALHSYFAISDICKISISGLEDTEYISKVEGVRTRQGDAPITFQGETDRVYVNTTSACVLEDLGLQRTITVTKTGSNSTVIWNPWEDKARSMADFANDEWNGMVCIETANALDNIVTVQPGKIHTITAEISVGKI
jgi:D-hexose-6-phosphate mutarotase